MIYEAQNTSTPLQTLESRETNAPPKTLYVDNFTKPSVRALRRNTHTHVMTAPLDGQDSLMRTQVEL